MRIILIALLIFLTAFSGKSQENPVLMTVNGTPVYKFEFEQIFWKNKKEDVASKKDLDEYMDLFTKFKLKVTEAEELGLDTATAFIKELQGYRTQLQKPYLVDSKVNEGLIQEAYDRIKNEVRASHLLILVDENASAEDTLKAYNKVKSIKEDITSGKISFVDAAKKYSEDESVKNNNGNLGYFTAFRMVYSFESAAFNTPVGQISEPFRTRFGYHLVKVVDKRPGRGAAKVAHIMLTSRKGANAMEKQNTKKKINEIYQRILKGDSFEKMAREFSEDRQSAAKGGELKWIKPGETFADFDSVAFSLKENGDMSEPILTQAGWHIIKRIDYKPVGELESMRSELKNKIQRDSRSQISKEIFVNKLKTEYSYSEKKKLFKKLTSKMDSTAVLGKWKYVPHKKMKKVVATFADQTVTLEDVAKYIEKTQRPMSHKNINKMVDEKFEALMVDRIMQYEKTQLEIKHPDYKALLKEYRDGILLFEITDQKVWSKGVKDTLGLKKFYEENKMNYMWPNRVKAKKFSSADKNIIDEAYQLVSNGELQNDSIVNYLNRDSQLNVKFEDGIFNKDEFTFNNEVKWNEGLNTPVLINERYQFVVLEKELPSEPKKLTEAKGLITAAYQDALEKEWIEELRKKYKVEINKDVLYTVTKKP